MSALATSLMGSGVPPLVATQLGFDTNKSITVPAGTAQLSDSAALTAGTALVQGWNLLTTAVGQTAVQLLSTIPVGADVYVWNTTATAALVFPPSGCSIQGGSANASFSVAQNKPTRFIRVSSTQFVAILSA